MSSAPDPVPAGAASVPPATEPDPTLPTPHLPPALSPEQSLALSRAQIAAALRQPLGLLLLHRLLGPDRLPIA